MYALAINGSPRKGGNTELLLNEVLDELKNGGWETELVKVGGTSIRGCIACNKCFENKDNECSVKKDNFNEISDGWYIPSGGHYFYGIQASKVIRQSYDISMRLGATNAQGNDENALL